MSQHHTSYRRGRKVVHFPGMSKAAIRQMIFGPVVSSDVVFTEPTLPQGWAILRDPLSITGGSPE